MLECAGDSQMSCSEHADASPTRLAVGVLFGPSRLLHDVAFQ
jgi:hypothetical protein